MRWSATQHLPPPHWFEEFRLTYRHSNDFERVVVDSSDKTQVGRRAVYNGNTVESFDAYGVLEREDSPSRRVVPLEEWGSPTASAEDLLKTNDGWTRNDDGTIVLTRTDAAEEKVFVRDALGVPISYERRLDGRIVRAVERIEFELGAIRE